MALYLSNHREKVCSCWTSRWRRLKARNYYCFHSWSTMTTKSWRRSEGSVMVRRVRSSKTKLSQWVARKNTRTIKIRILILRKNTQTWTAWKWRISFTEHENDQKCLILRNLHLILFKLLILILIIKNVVCLSVRYQVCVINTPKWSCQSKKKISILKKKKKKKL